MRRHGAAAVIAILLAAAACAPVLDRSLMDQGDRAVSFPALREDPAGFRGRLFILGGVIVTTRLAEQGSRIEAVHVPVDGSGSFEESGRSEGRYLALYPADQGMLDPVVYRKGRRITIAAEFTGTESGRIDEMTYIYPVFRIKQVHLWRRERRHEPSTPHVDRWFSPHSYYYRHPWWNHPQRHAPMPARPPEPKHKQKQEMDPRP